MAKLKNESVLFTLHRNNSDFSLQRRRMGGVQSDKHPCLSEKRDLYRQPTYLSSNLLIVVTNEAALSVPRIIGFLLASSILGFLIGSMFALMSISIIRSNQASGEFPVKKALVIGGTLGAIIASTSLLILMF